MVRIPLLRSVLRSPILRSPSFHSSGHSTIVTCSRAAAGGAASDFGIAGSASVLTLEWHTEAYIDSGATVFASGNVKVSASADNAITACAAAVWLLTSASISSSV